MTEYFNIDEINVTIEDLKKYLAEKNLSVKGKEYKKLNLVIIIMQIFVLICFILNRILFEINFPRK